jgi:monoterpene epsilon-lactone hydrolase
MSQAQLAAIAEGVQSLYAGWGRGTGIAQMRKQWDEFVAPSPLPARTQAVEANGVPCRWVEADGATRERIVVFFHGGGYQIGSPASHHNVMAALSAACGCAVLGVDYRLAPEHRFPAPVDDALAVWRWLQASMPATRIALAGDSAGGNIAIALMTLLRDKSLPLPAVAVAMSPWVDLEATGRSFAANAERDPVTQRDVLLLMARTYLGKGGNARDPLASTLHANLARLAPLLVQAGTHEVLLDDARSLVERAQAQGTPATLSEWPGMVHAFQLFVGRLDEADAAVAEAGAFLQRHLNGAQR